jgi:hypothetical protein
MKKRLNGRILSHKVHPAARIVAPMRPPRRATQHTGTEKKHAHGSYSPARLRDRIMSPEAAAALFADGMTVGMSGFTRAGDCKAVPFALAERAARSRCRSP